MSTWKIVWGGKAFMNKDDVLTVIWILLVFHFNLSTMKIDCLKDRESSNSADRGKKKFQAVHPDIVLVG